VLIAMVALSHMQKQFQQEQAEKLVMLYLKGAYKQFLLERLSKLGHNS